MVKVLISSDGFAIGWTHHLDLNPLFIDKMHCYAFNSNNSQYYYQQNKRKVKFMTKFIVKNSYELSKKIIPFFTS